jgi:DNA gyrase/topoisomerase IV subunit A
MGSLSLDVDPKLADLALVVGGGEEFLARLKSLQQAKQDHEAAAASLNLGVSAKRAMEDAQEKQRLADAALAGAQAQARQVREAAQAEADALISAARIRHSDAEHSAESALSSATQQAMAVLQDVTVKQADAEALRDEAARLQAEAKMLKQSLEQQTAAVAGQQRELDAIRADLQNKRALLLATAARLKEQS